VAQVSITELLEAGVHFGHQTRRWNPKMRRFIHGERGGIYIIDLLKTQVLLAQAQEFASTLAHSGGTVLFVGTKKQACDTIRDVAEAAGMPYVNHRWLGGLLTNFQTISLRIRRLHDLERFAAEGQLELLPTRERMAAQADLAKLRANLGGVKNMQRVPNAMFVIDLKTEVIAVREAQRLRIPIIGVVDTNCDPDGIDFVVPGNDDAIRSCALLTQAIGQVVAEGHSVFRAEEERARQEAEEKARLEAEARAQREAEEQARREAEQREADEAAAAAAAQAAAQGAPPGATPAEPAAAAAAASEQPARKPAKPPRSAATSPTAEQATDQAVADAPAGAAPDIVGATDEPEVMAEAEAASDTPAEAVANEAAASDGPADQVGPGAPPQADPEAESGSAPQADLKAEPAAEPEAESAAEPTAESAAEPTAESAAEPTAEPAAEPDDASEAKPGGASDANAHAEPEVEPTAEPTKETTAS
jgi:small subunit ribosomal protein S2